MKAFCWFACLFTFSVLLAVPGLGQQTSGAGAAGAPQAKPSTASEASIAATLDREVGMYEKLMVDAAEAMPEEKYNFTPASLNIPGSAFTDVRSFGVLVKHTAAENYLLWTPVTGEKAPENIKGPNGPDELKTKAQIVQLLKDSFAAGHRAAQSLTPANVVEPVPFRNNSAPRLFLTTFALVHCGDDYGQMVEYLRMNGIVPPASRGR
jgi:hypothetical protein